MSGSYLLTISIKFDHYHQTINECFVLLNFVFLDYSCVHIIFLLIRIFVSILQNIIIITINIIHFGSDFSYNSYFDI
jgi:hypothetical protein